MNHAPARGATPPSAASSPSPSRLGHRLPGAVLFRWCPADGGRGRFVEIGESLFTVFALSPADALASPRRWGRRVHPADRTALSQAIRQSAVSGEPIAISLRMRHADGALHDMRLQAGPVASSGDWEGVVVDLGPGAGEARSLAEEAAWQDVLGRLPFSVTLFDASLRIRFINDAHARWYGLPVRELIGRSLLDVVGPERYARLLPRMQAALAGDACVFENQVSRDGIVHWRYNSMVPERGADGSVRGVMSIAIDDSERRRAEIALAQKQAELRGLFEAIPDLVFYRDAEGIYRACNRAFESFYGLRPGEMVGRGLDQLYDPDTAERSRAEDIAAMRTEQAYRGEETLRGAGRSGVFDIVKSPFRDGLGKVAGLIGIARDVTDRKRAEYEVERLAFYDSLTGLPNRRLLLTRLKTALAEAGQLGHHGAVLFLDIDHFKNLNDTLGHAVGDQLLQQVAGRLVERAAPGRSAARFGGDEFVLVCENLGGDVDQALAEARRIAAELMTQLHLPFAVGERQHHASASIGVAPFGGGLLSAEELLKRADLAVHQAKAAGRNTVRFFDPEMEERLRERSVLEADLRAGLGREELRLHYQPVVDGDGRVLGAEALVRWQHPTRGLVPPLAFIPMAEESGLILPLGQWVLRQACEQLVLWGRRPATRQLTIAINLSARQFRHPDFVDQVEAVLETTGANAGRLKFELTETLLFHDVEDILGKMGRLRARGVGFSLDDFGTGYSSLSYVKRLPLDQLKIDQSFVRDVLTDPNDAAIVRTTLTLALSLGLDIVAEGVETHGQLDFLRQHGCRAFQGYLFGRPLPIAEMERQHGLLG
ncbi:EAL domain-containing protein [Xylophilus sp. GOD-11R]|uniref:bifunctional diguanylate cyclase/phosphodiesterase n=1 Tax=Xylophilus sp. GOD-11R TaxID=3089814 RepID=UPI00298C8664|nr:EAL domain-containing protein [Xylophilus sp. GOD-11R]WPB56028.1 EAL domain-containing protein [Xylophilus sp. GOD-11R]